MPELTFTPVIGIEIHIRLKSASKLFCSCSTNTDAEPNTNICPVCMGLPGSLPYLNHHVVEQGMLAGFALNCGIRHKSLFFRKSYFYPDLPKGTKSASAICLSLLQATLRFMMLTETSRKFASTTFTLRRTSGVCTTVLRTEGLRAQIPRTWTTTGQVLLWRK